MTAAVKRHWSERRHSSDQSRASPPPLKMICRCPVLRRSSTRFIARHYRRRRWRRSSRTARSGLIEQSSIAKEANHSASLTVAPRRFTTALGQRERQPAANLRRFTGHVTHSASGFISSCCCAAKMVAGRPAFILAVLSTDKALRYCRQSAMHPGRGSSLGRSTVYVPIYRPRQQCWTNSSKLPR